jgi:hypothetical protein
MNTDPNQTRDVVHNIVGQSNENDGREVKYYSVQHKQHDDGSEAKHYTDVVQIRRTATYFSTLRWTPEEKYYSGLQHLLFL